MKKEKLFRKVNTKARGVHHFFGYDAKYDRNTKNGISKNMKHGVKRGLDYTPLYKFLLSKIGESWDKIYSEAVSRLDSPNAIYHIVEKDNLGTGYVYLGESTIYSTLFVDENNTLQKIKPEIQNSDFIPLCPCCTFTFNGKVLIKKYSKDK